MTLKIVLAVVVLPGTVLVHVPAIIYWVTAGTPAAMEPGDIADATFWPGVLLTLAGLVFVTWTVRLFATAGKGTLAPWAPPTKLVVSGPYRHVRNPMIAGVMLMLGGEALLLNSWPLAAELALFILVTSTAFILFEEPELEQRFGESYRRYKADVPRWIPRIKPWQAP